MSDNVLQTLQKLVQDVIAPDVRETKVGLEALEKRRDDRFTTSDKRTDERFAALEKRIDERFAAQDKRMDDRFNLIEDRFAFLSSQMEANHKILLTTFGELRANAELIARRGSDDRRERVAIIERELSLRKAS